MKQLFPFLPVFLSAVLTLSALTAATASTSPGPSAFSGSGFPEDENMFTVHVKVTHRHGQCPLKENKNHFWASAGLKFSSPNDEDWECPPTIYTFFSFLGQEQASQDIPLHECFAYYPGLPFDLRDYSLKLDLGVINDIRLQGHTSPDPGAEEGVQYEAFNPGRPVVSIPVRNLLSGKYRTSYACSDLEVWLTTKCELAIQNTSTQFVGFPYNYTIQAGTACPEGNGITYGSGAFLWEYFHSGMKGFKPLDHAGNHISISPYTIPDIPVGENILIKVADGRASNATNTKALYFYPDIPQPTSTRTQSIPAGQSSLKELQLRFDRPLNPDMDERLRVITLYDTIIFYQNGQTDFSEARIIYQQQVDISRLQANNSYTLPLPAVLDIGEGRYYVSVEGTARQKSNHPEAEDNRDLPAEIKSAMFQIVPFQVKKSEVKVSKVEFTPPACHGQNGQVRVTLDENFMLSTKPLPKFYYLNAQGTRIPIDFTCESRGGFGLNQSVFSCNEIDSDKTRIEVEVHSNTVVGSEEIRWGAFEIGFTQPPRISVPISSKDISGFYYENGRWKASSDGKITVRRSQAANGSPPYFFSYYDLVSAPLQRQTLNSDLIPVSSAGPYLIVAEDQKGCSMDSTIHVRNLNRSLKVGLKVENEISCFGAYDGSLLASIEERSSDQLVFSWYKNGSRLSGENGISLRNIGAGTYMVKLSDQETGMVSSATATLTQPTRLELITDNVTPVYCKGETSGYVGVAGKGGTPPYLYSWEDGFLGNMRSGMRAGSYLLRLIDDRQCRVEKEFRITEPDSVFDLQVDSVVHAHYDQEGKFRKGKVFPRAQGGTRPYGWVYCDGNPNLDSLAAGKHNLNQWDAMHCQDDEDFEILSFPPLQVSIRQDRPVLCHGMAQAACHVEISGGVPPYRIVWNTGHEGRQLQALAAGTYHVCVTDAYGIFRTDSLSVSQPDSLQAEITLAHPPGHAGCFAGFCPPIPQNGQIGLRVQGGTPPYRLGWKRNGEIFLPETGRDSLAGPAPVESLFTDLGPGRYQILVSDRNGCQSLVETELRQAQPLRASIHILQPIGCAGEASGALEVFGEGGVPPYAYQWFQARQGLSEENLLQEFLKGTDFPDFLDSLQKAGLLQPMGTDGNLGGLPVGAYLVCLQDASGQSAYALTGLLQPDPLQLHLDSLRHPSYPGSTDGILPEWEDDGWISVHASGGTPPYRFEWKLEGQDSVLSREPVLQARPAGLYILTVLDRNDCSSSLECRLTETPPLRVSVQIADSVSCAGMQDGSLSAEVEGGRPPYHIRWERNPVSFVEAASLAIGTEADETGQEGEAARTLSGLPAGTYVAQVTDSLGVKASFRIVLPGPDSLHVRLESRPAACFGDSSGWVAARVEGGTAPYTFLWTVDGKPARETSALLSGLESADIQVDIEDYRGCRTRTKDRIQAPDSLRVHAILRHPSPTGSLFGQNPEPPTDGSIQLIVDGGVPPYRFTWSHGDTTSSLQDLDTGFYHVTVSDAMGCPKEASVRLVRPPVLSAKLETLTHPDCSGEKTGSLSLRVEGGTPPYRFHWFLQGEWWGQDSSLRLDNLEAGTYRVEVRDSKNVLSMDSASILSPLPLKIEADIQAASAWTLANGSIHVRVSGGSPPYVFEWNTGHKDSLLSAVGRGTYRLLVTDAKQCQIEKEYFLPSPDSLYIQSFHIRHLPASESPGLPGNPSPAVSGGITVQLSGGVKPYRYQWENIFGEVLRSGLSDSSLLDIEGLSTGLYRLHVQDKGGAEVARLFEIKEVKDLEASLLLVQGIACHGDSSARLKAFIQGGLEPWTWLWEKYDSLNGFDTLALYGLEAGPLTAGLYRFTAWDASGEHVADTLEIAQPDPLGLQTEILYPDGLPDTADGLFLVEGHGGTLPYRFLWNTGQSGNRHYFSNNQSYTVYLQDANGCVTRQNLDSLISSRMELSILPISGINCHGDSSGSLQLDIQGGKAPFLIRWSNGDSLPLAKNLPAGIHQVKVTDALGRCDSASYPILEPEALQNKITVQIPRCHASADGEIRVQTEGGSGDWQYFWNTGASTADLLGLAEGTYILHTTDRYRCQRRDTVIMQAPEELRLQPLVSDILCPGGTGRIEWQAQGGTAPYAYHWERLPWNNPLSVEEEGSSWNIDPAPEGKYLLRVTDNQACQTDTSISLYEPEPPRYNLRREQTFCAGQILWLEVEGADSLPSMEYLWFLPDGSSSDQPRITADQAGTYRLTLVQNQSCVYRDSVLVTSSTDSIHAEFWVSSHIEAGQSCLLVDLSRHEPDSSRWVLPPEASLLSREGKYVELLFAEEGRYPVELQVFKGGCFHRCTRNIEVRKAKAEAPWREEAEKTATWSVSPNPFRNEFLLHGISSRDTEVRYWILSASTGKTVESGRFHARARTPVKETLFKRPAPAGPYILLLEYGEGNLWKDTFKLVRTL